MANILSIAKENHRISKMSLQDVQKKYGDGPIFLKELVRRSKKNLEEVRRFFKEEPEFDWSDFGDKCRFLKLSTITVLLWDNIKEIPNFIAEAYLYDRTDWLETPVTKKVSNNFLKTMLLKNDNAYKYPQLLNELTESNLYNILINPKIDPRKIPNIEDLVSRLPLEFIKKIVEYFMITENYELLYELNKNLNLSRYIVSYLFDKDKTFSITTQISVINEMPDDFIKNLLDEAIQNILEKLDLEKLELLLSSKFFTCMSSKDVQKLLTNITYETYATDLVDKAWEKIMTQKNSKIAMGVNEMFALELELNGNVPAKISVPEFVIDSYLSTLFSSTIPKEIVDEFRQQGITPAYIREHKNFEPVLKTLPLNILFKNVFVLVLDETKGKEITPTKLSTYLEKNLGYDKAYEILSEYIDYFPIDDSLTIRKDMILFQSNKLEDILETINSYVKKCFDEGLIKIDEFIHPSFKEKYSYMFLDKDIPSSLRESFYKKELETNHFVEHREDLKYFQNANIAYGLKNAPEVLRTVRKFSTEAENNIFLIDVMTAYEAITDESLKQVFIDYISISTDKILPENVHKIASLYNRLSISPNMELIKVKNQVAKKLLVTPNPEYCLSLIEAIFNREDIPFVGKLYTIFEATNRGLTDFDFSKESIASPILKSLSSASRQITIFADLIKISLGSNNRSFKRYIETIEKGFMLFNETDISSFDAIDSTSKEILIKFCNYLEKLYNASDSQKKEHFKKSGNILFDLTSLQKLFTKNGKIEEDIPDRIVKMYCHFAGFDTIQSLKTYMNSKAKKADIKNRMLTSKGISLQKGDFIKNIGKVENLGYILQNGVLANEYLMDFKGDTGTSLDIELTRVTTDHENFSIINDMDYEPGTIFIVLKNDDRFTETRKDGNDSTGDINKLEIYTSSPEKYGLRTGFASSEIDYLIVNEYDQRIGLEIALNGFYIPVINTSGKVLFTPEDYDILKNKISGMPYYSQDAYHFSHNLVFSGIEDILSVLNEKGTEDDYMQKNNDFFTTEDAIESKLRTIKTQDKEKYRLVLANIVLAKKILKSVQNGMNEAGLENWILSNGGSFIDAANDFLGKASDKDFQEFKKSYAIWDFGNNELATKEGRYNHNNFIDDMDEISYKEMNACLRASINSLRVNSNTEKRSI